MPCGSGFTDDPHARTHHQGWPMAKRPARNSASIRRAIRSSIWGHLHRANNHADRHALSEYAFLMHMLWIVGFTSHMACSIPGRNRVDRHFLFDHVVIILNHGGVGCDSSLRSCGPAAHVLWMLCVSACPASEKLHICTAQSHAWHESFDMACTSSKSSTPPRSATC